MKEIASLFLTVLFFLMPLSNLAAAAERTVQLTVPECFS